MKHENLWCRGLFLWWDLFSGTFLWVPLWYNREFLRWEMSASSVFSSHGRCFSVLQHGTKTKKPSDPNSGQSTSTPVCGSRPHKFPHQKTFNPTEVDLSLKCWNTLFPHGVCIHFHFDVICLDRPEISWDNICSASVAFCNVWDWGIQTHQRCSSVPDVTGPWHDQDQSTTTLFGRAVGLKFQDQKFQDHSMTSENITVVLWSWDTGFLWDQQTLVDVLYWSAVVDVRQNFRFHLRIPSILETHCRQRAAQTFSIFAPDIELLLEANQGVLTGLSTCCYHCLRLFPVNLQMAWCVKVY